MTSRRKLALGLFILALLMGGGELLRLQLPTLSWPFETSRDIALLRYQITSSSDFNPFLNEGAFLWFGWFCVIGLILASIGLYSLPPKKRIFSPMSARRWQRFRTMKRGYYSLIFLCGLAFLCCCDQLIVGKRALVVYNQGHWYFPAFVQEQYSGKTFGLTGDASDSETNYRQLKAHYKRSSSKDFVLMPIIPFDSTGDSLPPSLERLEQRNDGVLYRVHTQKPYSGLASQFYDIETQNRHLRSRLRHGQLDGLTLGWLPDKSEVYSATWKKGTLLREKWIDEARKETFLLPSSNDYYITHYHPIAPLQGDHLLGTTPQGLDIVAYLFGGLQINFKAIFFFLPFVYGLGAGLGMLMGYWGGWFDLIMQRLIEIFSQIPFLLVIIILASMIPLEWRGFPLIITLLVLFSWMSLTYQFRTSTMKEKTRDYVSAARLCGASTARILWVHLLPNLVSLLVTWIPFSVAALILSLASLDYLGFGLPEQYAGWGRLLNTGLQHLSSPWVVSSAFIALVGFLLLITFIGEAVREAYDPKQFTLYR